MRIKRTAASNEMTDPEGAVSELEQLRHRMEQLQAENERLARGTGNDASGSSIQPVRQEQAFYLPRERRCPKFSGSATAGSLSVEEWVEEAQSCIRSRHMSAFEKALFLFDHLEGEARNEIKYRPTATRENPDLIIKVLKEVYGCPKSYVYWQQRFFDRKQKEQESLFEFSHALMALMDKVKQAKSDSLRNPDIVLRDQFCENVCDPMLRRELKRLVRESGELSLLDVRKEALRWAEEGQRDRERSHRVSGRSSETQVVSQCAATATPSPEFSELKDLVLKQQAQLDMLVRQLGHTRSQSQAPQSRRGDRYKRAPDGQPICLICDKPGHIARYCQTFSARNSRPTLRFPSDHSSSQSVRHEQPTSQPEN